MSDQILNGWQIESISIYYENLIIRTSDEKVYYITPLDLVDVVKEGNYQIVQKRTRTWLKPINVDDAGNVHLSDYDNEKLSALLDEFERQTKIETGVKGISGGYAQADYSSHDNDWLYVTLKWGTQNDVDNDTHEEDWKISMSDFHRSESIKKTLLNLEPCN